MGQQDVTHSAFSRRAFLLGSAVVAVGCGPSGNPVPPRGAAGFEPAFGSSAFSFPRSADYKRQVELLGIQSAFVYQPENASWDDLCRVINPAQDIWLSVSTTDIGTLLKDMPVERAGRIFLHYQQEPHDNMEFDDWAQASREIFAKAAGRSYVVPSAEFSAYAFLHRPDGRWFIDEVACYGFSSFADVRVVDGHAVALTDPSEELVKVASWAASFGKAWSVAACGFGIPTSLMNDPKSHANRLTWTSTHMEQARRLKALHYQWFNVLWEADEGLLDYRLEEDPKLLALWHAEAGG